MNADAVHQTIREYGDAIHRIIRIRREQVAKKKQRVPVSSIGSPDFRCL